MTYHYSHLLNGEDVNSSGIHISFLQGDGDMCILSAPDFI